MSILGSGVAQFSFTLKQGADLSIPMTWSDDNGAPMPLTGYVFELAICPSPGGAPLLELSSASTTGSHIVLDGPSGFIELVFASEDTGTLVAAGIPVPNPSISSTPVYKLGTHDLKFTDTNGNVGYLFEGTVYLDPRSTA